MYSFESQNGALCGEKGLREPKEVALKETGFKVYA